MLRKRFARLLGLFGVGATLTALGAASCSVPEYQFPDEQGAAGGGGVVIEHCVNGLLDSELGESDYDCGGGCEPCSLSQHCGAQADCAEGICHEGTCREEGCMNGFRDGAETDADCGGSDCDACSTGDACREDADCASEVCDAAQCRGAGCDDAVKNGSETGLDCGGDCVPCAVDQPCISGSDCLSGECNDDNVCGPTCPDGLANCDGLNETACEVNTRTDLLNCGECDHACELPHASAECSAGECRVVSGGCDEGWEDCNGQPEDGCEVEPASDELNCGACNAACPAVNGAPFCEAGECEINCAAGFADCDDARGNGCEKSVSKDVNNCGECGKKCTPEAGGTPYCKDDACGETICPAGFGDCNGEPDDGCEVDLRTDPDNCDSCGSLCLAANGTASCSNRECAIAECDEGYDDCSGGYADGCETNIDTSTSHCGGCGDACTIASGTPKCEAGDCQVNNCNSTFRDCNGNAADGCEINVATNQANCGGCGDAGSDCGTLYAHAGALCSNSSCGPPSCDAGYGNCDTDVGNGCETSTTANDNHCGGCGLSCDDVHGTNTCSDSECTPVCSGAYLSCDEDSFNGCEANSSEDERHCGGCGQACSTATAAHVSSNECVGSSCDPQCTGAFRNCDSNENNGCETNSATNASHCGACGQVCSTTAAAHVTSNTCSGGACQPDCSGLWDDCDTSRLNGCEKDVSVDESNCGGCGVVCGTTHAASSTCTSGVCVPACETGWKACSSAQNGCTTQLGTASNCTACGEACTGTTPFCITGSGCSDHRDLVVANSGLHGIAGWNGSSTPTDVLTVSHTLTNASGNARMVLVGVTATDSVFDPETLTYAGTAMIRAVQSKAATSYAAVYYLLDAALPAAAGTANAVTATFSSTFAWGHGGLDVIELKNAMQTAPLLTATHLNNAACSTGQLRSLSATFNQPGSFVYGVLGSRGASGAVMTPAMDLTQTWSQRQTMPDVLLGTAAYALDDNDRLIEWTVSGCYDTAGAMVVVKRLSGP